MGSTCKENRFWRMTLFSCFHHNRRNDGWFMLVVSVEGWPVPNWKNASHCTERLRIAPCTLENMGKCVYVYEHTSTMCSYSFQKSFVATYWPWSIFLSTLFQGQLWLCHLLWHKRCLHCHRERQQAPATQRASVWPLLWRSTAILQNQLRRSW